MVGNCFEIEKINTVRISPWLTEKHILYLYFQHPRTLTNAKIKTKVVAS